MVMQMTSAVRLPAAPAAAACSCTKPRSHLRAGAPSSVLVSTHLNGVPFRSHWFTKLRNHAGYPMSMSPLKVFQKTAALRTPAGCLRIQRKQHFAAPVHASSSAASWPSAGPSRPMLSSTLAIFAAFFRACSQAVQKTCQKVRYWQTSCRKSCILQMTALGPRARLA